MKPMAIRPLLSTAMLSSLASSGLLHPGPWVTATLAPSAGEGTVAAAHCGLVPAGTQPTSPDSGVKGGGSAMHCPRIGRQYLSFRPTSVQLERKAPVSAQSSQPVQG